MSILESKRKLIEERADLKNYFQISKEAYKAGAEWMALEDMAEISELKDTLQNVNMGYSELKSQLSAKDAEISELKNRNIQLEQRWQETAKTCYEIKEDDAAKDALLREALKALEEINREELNSQRPGGEHSKSARISFEALTKIKAELGEK